MARPEGLAARISPEDLKPKLPIARQFVNFTRSRGLFHEVLREISAIGTPPDRDYAYRVVATQQFRALHIPDAIGTLRRVNETRNKVQALSDGIEHFSELGIDPSFLIQRTLPLFDNPELGAHDREYALGRIIGAEGRVGKFEEARAHVQLVPAGKEREGALRNLLYYHKSREDYEGFRQTVQLLPPSQQADAYIELAKYQAEKEIDPKPALDTAKDIALTAGGSRDKRIELAGLFARNGEFDTAIQLIRSTELDRGDSQGRESIRSAEISIAITAARSGNLQYATELTSKLKKTSSEWVDLQQAIAVGLASQGEVDKAKEVAAQFRSPQDKIVTLANIAAQQLKRSDDPSETVEEALDIASNLQSKKAVSVGYAAIARVLIQAERLEEAGEVGNSVEEIWMQTDVIQDISMAYAVDGVYDRALSVTSSIASLPDKASTYVDIAELMAENGENPEVALSAAKDLLVGVNLRSSDRACKIALAIADIEHTLGENPGEMIDFAKTALKKIPAHRATHRVKGLLDLAESEWKFGMDGNSALQEAVVVSRRARYHRRGSRGAALGQAAYLLYEHGGDPTPIVKEILDELVKNGDDYYSRYYHETSPIAEVLVAQKLLGVDGRSLVKDKIEALLSSQKVSENQVLSVIRLIHTQAALGVDPLPDFERLVNAIKSNYDSIKERRGVNQYIELLSQVAYALSETGLGTTELQGLPSELRAEILENIKGNKFDEQRFVSYYGLANSEEFQEYCPSSASQIAFLLGQAHRSRESIGLATNPRALMEVRKIIQEETSPASAKSFVEGIVFTKDYEAASSELFAILKTDKPEDERAICLGIRVLKGLIEIDNPKGKTIATRLFANEDSPYQYRVYIAKKLFADGYWDPELGMYLSKQTDPVHQLNFSRGVTEVIPRREYQLNVLTRLIRNFGLTPDLPAYKMLEAQGELRTRTLGSRVVEMLMYKSEFAGKSRDELCELFASNEEACKTSYILHGGEFRYAVVNDYSFNKFKTVVERIGSLQVHQPTLDRFEQILAQSMDPAEAKAVVIDLAAGKPLVTDERVFRLSASVEYETAYEQAMARLQTVWKTELRSLLINKAADLTPQTVEESLLAMQNLNQRQYEGQLYRLIIRLRLNQDKLSLNDIQAVALDLRNSMVQAFRQKGDRENERRVRNATELDVIKEYLERYMPQSPATSEWGSHLEETITQFKEAGVNIRQGSTSSDRTYELTFLDKNEDFVRSIRFADAAQCCFNASRENFQHRTYEFVTRLNKDPLSFMMDLKELDSRDVVGFVFGRMAINPATGRPVIMLNGIYSQVKGEILTNKVLQTVETQIGRRLNAEAIVIKAIHGGNIQQPAGYENGNIELEAIRALQDQRGNPEEHTYDDIGTVANGKFAFSGFIKYL